MPLYDLVIPAIVVSFFGLAIGSFLNVVIYRVPKQESIVKVSSHCMSCGHQLHWYELIPLFSYLAQGGRCRACKVKLSPQYPIIEAANMLLYFGVIMIKGWSLTSILYCGLGSCFLALSVIDFRTYEIPFGINVVIFVLGLIRLAFDLPHWYNYLIGFFLVSLPMFIFVQIYYKVKGVEAFGGGDIKLLAAAGLLVGWKMILLGFILGCIIGSVVHVVRMKLSDEDHVLAMGPYLSIGIMIAVLFGEQLLGLYTKFVLGMG